MTVTASELRQNIYRLLDQVLESGIPLEIERNGRRPRVTPVHAPSKLARLVERPDYMVGDPGDFVHLDWSAEWKPHL